MSRLPIPDLTRLAILAQTRAGDLKPVLLKVHAMTFAADETHSAAAVETFETLALGLIPHVSPHVADQVRAMLEGRADVPQSVLDLLVRSGTGSAPAPAPDDATAERIRVLVRSGRRHPALARELLARPDLGVFDRALLYRHAEEPARDALREDLAARLAVQAEGNVRSLSTADRSVLTVVAQAAGFTAATAQIARFLGAETVPDWKPHRPLDAEFFALALVALGLGKEESARLLLTVDDAISHSVRTVFRLYAVARTTTTRVAAHLVACELDLAEPALRGGRPAAEHGRDAPSLGARPGTLRPGAATLPRERAAEGSARPDGRSRSTTGRDRS